MSVLLVQGDARQIPLRDGSVHCVVTSPPYWGLRSYSIGVEHGEIGLEDRADCNGAFTGMACGACWICAMRAVFKEVHRVLRPEATLWVNCGDAYTSGGRTAWCADAKWPIRGRMGRPPQPPGLREKNLLGMPWRLALALQSDGWVLRSEIIWAKKNCMPESVQDRVVRAHEQIFMFSKQPRYFFDMETIRETATMRPQARLTPQPRREGQHAADGWAEPRLLRETPMLDGNPNGRAMRSVLSLASEPTPYAHFATFPTALVRKCLLAGAPRRVCSACGKPHVRQVEREYILLRQHRECGDTLALAHGADGRSGDRKSVRSHTTGFSPTCACNAPTRPGVAFDPFVGSGTTLLVARELGLDAVGTDLSWAYLHEIARERLGLAALHRWTTGATPPPVSYGDLPLFAEESV